MEDSQSNSSSSKSEPANDPGKMFIGGLSANTTAESLRDYFETFGEIKEVMVMRDPVTKRSRGFGFVTFADPVSVEKVRDRAPHTVDDRTVDAKVAVPKRPQPKMVTRTKKIFVGGLSPQTSLEDLKNYFEREFGKTTDAMIMFDKTTQRSRGFGFVTFETEDIVEEICKTHYHNISGKKVEAKKAQPKEVMFPQLRGRAGRGFLPYFDHPYITGYGRGFGPGFSAHGAFGFPFPAAYNPMAAYQAAGRGRGRERYFPPGYPGNAGFAGYPPYMSQGHRARPSHGQYYTDYSRPQAPRGEHQAPVNSLQTDYTDYSGVQMNPQGNYGPQQAGFGPPPPSPVNRGFAPATSPGPAAVAQDISGYMASAGVGGNGGGAENMGYSAGSPQPSAFGTAPIAVCW